MAARRCILLFSRGPSAEARAKGMRSPQLFDLARRRIERIARATGASLVVATAQRGATFGERLANAYQDAARTFAEIVVVPIDVPQLAMADVARAFALLATHELVLGPCEDGGVYLIAGRTEAAARFRTVRWLTPHVLDDLRDGAALLPRLPDVDGAADVARIAAWVPASLIHEAFPSLPAPLYDRHTASAAVVRGPPPQGDAAPPAA